MENNTSTKVIVICILIIFLVMLYFTTIQKKEEQIEAKTPLIVPNHRYLDQYANQIYSILDVLRKNEESIKAMNIEATAIAIEAKQYTTTIVASHDEDQNSFEEEQRLSTAFMTKSDTDTHRIKILKRLEQLQSGLKQASIDRNNMFQALHQTASAYNSLAPDDPFGIDILKMFERPTQF
jgi:hypothetical protein